MAARFLGSLRRRIRCAMHDAAANRRHVRGEQRFLVARHVDGRPRFNEVLLAWAAAHVPEARARYELRLLPLALRDPARYALHLPWLQDPVEAWSPRAYRQALRLTAACDRHGIPTVNRVERLAAATKSRACALMAAAGVRTPRAAPIDDADLFRRTLLGLELPILVRDDAGHAGPDALEDGEVVRCDTLAEARAVDLARFARPVAIEFVETRDPRDGLYRKYRYVAAGDRGAPHHLQVMQHWFVKGRGQLYSEAIRDEDAAYLAGPDPNHALLQRARRALGLDVVAFDYAYDPEGRVVVWEANPFPFFHFLPGRRAYRTPAVERAFAAILQLHHERAGLPAPEVLRRWLPEPAGAPA